MNKHQRIKAAVITTAMSVGALFGGAAQADQTLDKVLAVSQSKTAAGQQSQQRVDKLQEETASLLSKYKKVNKDVEGLRVYNAQLEKQIEKQRQKVKDLADAIDNVTILQRQVPPLAVRMLDSLEQFVDLDVPFKIEERRDNLEIVRDNMDRADFTIAEKFRQVLERYNVEAEYGRKISAYTGVLEVGGQEREVDILAVGRIALMYQTKDQKLSGAWDQTVRSWVEIDSGEYRKAIRHGIKIATKRASNNVMALPILAPEAAQ
ncbi:MAG: hypothetical protein ACI93R_001775 [Flavobacteriales bacterium]|jgi:hypothetical protein